MKTSVKRLLALLCVVAVGSATMASCKKDTVDQTSSEEYEIEYVYETEEGEATASGEGETSTGASSGKNNSNKNNSNKNNSNKNNSSTASSTGVIKQSGSYHKWDYSKFKGTTVTFAMWTDFVKPYADNAIALFEKETGMKFKYMDIPQTDYVKTVVGKIASKEAPDVVIENSEFPATMSILQPVNDYVDLTDSIWDKDYLEAYTINGKTYALCCEGSLFGGGGGAHLLWYNKTFLKKAGVPEPAELYAAGNWTWDTLGELMKQYVASPTKVSGTGAMYFDDSYFLSSIGASFYNYDPKTATFTSNIDDPLLTKAITKLGEWSKAGYAKNSGHLLSGGAAMQLTFTITKQDVKASKVSINDLGFTYPPNFDSENKIVTSVGGKGWGICKGAKNPEAAGIFIKYYSDPGNYDAGEFFVNDEFTDLFFKVKTMEAKKYRNVNYGVLVASGERADKYYNVGKNADPNQVSAYINSMKNAVKKEAEEATKVLQQAIK